MNLTWGTMWLWWWTWQRRCLCWWHPGPGCGTDCCGTGFQPGDEDVKITLYDDVMVQYTVLWWYKVVMWYVDAGNYQAVDEEVDGGVDYRQVTGNEVCKPLGKIFNIYYLQSFCHWLFKYVSSYWLLATKSKQWKFALKKTYALYPDFYTFFQFIWQSVFKKFDLRSC